MGLSTVDRVLAWIRDDEFPPERQEELLRCINAATDSLAEVTGRTIERATKTVYLDGCDAGGPCGELLHLPRGDRPVIHGGSDLVTVSENGTAVTVATGYSTTAGVVLKNANLDRPCILVRNYTAWQDGYQNIAVTYKCGWTIDVPGDTAPAPNKVVQLVNAMAWKIFTEPAWIGKINVAQAGSSVTFIDDLPSIEADTLRSLMVL